MAGDYRYTKDGTELPTIGGLRWLKMLAIALCIQSSGRNPELPQLFLRCKRMVDNRVATTKCDKTGKVILEFTLHDQTKRVFRVPTGMINNHDTRAVLKLIMDDEFAGSYIFKDNHIVRAIH